MDLSVAMGLSLSPPYLAATADPLDYGWGWGTGNATVSMVAGSSRSLM